MAFVDWPDPDLFPDAGHVNTDVSVGAQELANAIRREEFEVQSSYGTEHYSASVTTDHLSGLVTVTWTKDMDSNVEFDRGEMYTLALNGTLNGQPVSIFDDATQLSTGSSKNAHEEVLAGTPEAARWAINEATEFVRR